MSLSSAGNLPFAAVTDDEDDFKNQIMGNCRGPSLITLSDELAVTILVTVWLAASVRAIDHCVEALCTLLQLIKGWEEVEDAAIKELKCMVPSLLNTEKNSYDGRSRHMA
jgi:alcohol dehydrogenase class IV